MGWMKWIERTPLPADYGKPVMIEWAEFTKLGKEIGIYSHSWSNFHIIYMADRKVWVDCYGTFYFLTSH